jgi:hypothetical protein
MHPSIGGLAKYSPDIICFYLALCIHPSVGWPKYLPDINCFYLVLCIHPSVGWPNIHLTSFVFSWHYASIHWWAGQIFT